jgi:hypothetical protein
MPSHATATLRTQLAEPAVIDSFDNRAPPKQQVQSRGRARKTLTNRKPPVVSGPATRPPNRKLELGTPRGEPLLRGEGRRSELSGVIR